MIRAVAYTRYSTNDQDSTEAQLDDIKEYATKNNISLIDTYIDEGRTGQLDKREAFQQMIRDAYDKKFDMIICHKVDRFGRNREDAVVYKSRLRKIGVQVKYATQNIEDSAAGRFMESMLENMAQYYSENLSEEVKQKTKVHAKKGKFCGGYPPLGYKVDKDKHYIIEESEALIVKKIFDLYAAGNSYKKVIDYCNEQGWKSKFNKPFKNNSLYSILHNKKYVGIYEYNKTPTRIDGKRNNHARKSDKEIIKLENMVPPIIEKELWERVQLIAKKNKLLKGQNKAQKEPYLLTGLIYCGKCSAKMQGKLNVNQQRKSFRYYCCSNRCGSKLVPKKNIEKLVLEDLQETYFSDEGLEIILAAYNEYINNVYRSKDSERKIIENTLKQVNKKINNIVQTITASGYQSEALVGTLKELENKKTSLEATLDAQTKIQKSRLTKKQFMQMFNLHKLSLQKNNISELKNILQIYIDKVVVLDVDNYEIFYTVPDSCRLYWCRRCDTHKTDTFSYKKSLPL